jgi:hypothetical protein
MSLFQLKSIWHRVKQYTGQWRDGKNREGGSHGLSQYQSVTLAYFVVTP